MNKGSGTFCTVEYYITVKKNEIVRLSGKWIDLRKITQSEKTACNNKTQNTVFCLTCGY